ncbi:MAG: polyprenyl synthetase family protein [Syntrophomonadaceae bacterium]|nr:polyprenyl synthetase family protein [Syntrophomonadaceae bacterium]
MSFAEELRRRQQLVEEHLPAFLPDPETFPPVIHQAMHYALFNGGKRLRPLLLLEAARVAGGDAEQVMPFACAVEMIHSYSLVHDDLPAMDDDDYRRGKPTCHRVFGEANAILAGDALLTQAFAVMTSSALQGRLDPRRALRAMVEIATAAGSTGMIGGQVIDLASEGQHPALEQLQAMHRMKTGALFVACLRSGAILAGAAAAVVDAFTAYGDALGLCFQITDDILDIEGDATVIGKPVGSDLKHDKATYPALVGLEQARAMARDCSRTAVASLQGFGPEADFLRGLASYVLERVN